MLLRQDTALRCDVSPANGLSMQAWRLRLAGPISGE